MGDKMKNLTVRSMSGLVLLVVVFGATLWSKWSFAALLLVILCGCQWEFYRMAKQDDIAPQRWFGMVLGVLFFLINFGVLIFMSNGYGVVLAMGGMLLFLLLVIPLMFVTELGRHRTNPIADLGATFLGVLYVALPVSLLLYIPVLAGTPYNWDSWAMLFYILLIWTNDVCAYLVGVTIGRHRMSKRISPKKSWEGFFGGIVGALGMGFLASYKLGGNLHVWLGLALLASITGVLGDLVESMFKRSVGIKDSGRILPGHGGWLDRFDALLLSVPFAFVYLLIVSLLSD